MNAFKWGLYQETDLDTGDTRLLNKQALAQAKEGDEIILSVQIDFEHDGKNYEAIRKQKFVKSGDTEKKVGSANLDLSWTSQQEGFDRAKNPEVQIKLILPHNLHTYFFFHGERIEKLASIEGTDQVRRSYKKPHGDRGGRKGMSSFRWWRKEAFQIRIKKVLFP